VREPPALVAWCEQRRLAAAGSLRARDIAALANMLPRHRELVATHRPRACRAPIRLWRADPRFRRTPCDWSGATTAALTETVVGGTHFSIMRSPHIEVIARDLDQLARTIDRTQ
jgi:thioesterase domain-containing protein